MTTITELPQDLPAHEALGILRVAFRKRHTVKVGSGMVDYCPYEGLRYDDGRGTLFIAAADAEVEGIRESAQRAYKALVTSEATVATPRTGTVAIRTSMMAANAVDHMMDTGDFTMKVTTSRKVGGYVHVPLARKEDALDIIGLALDVAGEHLRFTEEWEAEYEDCLKEVASLTTLFERVKAL